MLAASNSTPLIGLAKAGVFGLLRKLFDRVHIAPMVERELCEQGKGRPGESEVRSAVAEGWLLVRSPSASDIARCPQSLKAADREVLASALTSQADFVLSDDQQVMRAAAQVGVACLTTLDLMVLLKEQGHVPALRPLLESLQERGFHISADRIQGGLDRVGE